MKTIYISTCGVLTLVTACTIAVSIHYASALNSTKKIAHQLQAQSQASEETSAELTNTIQSDAATIAGLQDKVSQLTDRLGRNAVEMAAENDKLQSYEQAEQSRLADEANKTVPPPVDGVFSKVVGIHGETLALNATFGQQLGRKIIFRPANETPISIDVEALHPLMLKYIGIDPASALAKQQQMDAAWAAKTQADQAQGVVNYRSAEARQILEQKMAIAQQQADAASQAAAAAAAQAQADKENADAAWLNAQKPPPQINVNTIQQSQQRIY